MTRLVQKENFLVQNSIFAELYCCQPTQTLCEELSGQNVSGAAAGGHGPLLLRGQHLQVTSHPQSSISSPLLGCVGADLGWAPDCGPPADFLPPRPGTGLVLGGPRPGTTLVCTQRHLSSASVLVTHHIS